VGQITAYFWGIFQMWIQASNLAWILFLHYSFEKKRGPLKIQDGCQFSKWLPSRTWNSWADKCKNLAHMDTSI